MFFSVDVETARTDAMPGALLSIGAVAINEHLEQVDTFYCNLAFDEQSFDENTIKWWEEQSDDARRQAFSWAENRLHPFAAAVKFADWVNNTRGEEEGYFVANPVSFDFSWISMLFSFSGIENPFNHRTICLRSLRYGVTGGKWGASRGGDELFPELDPTESTIPHNAYSDADAQGEDFINLMRFIQNRNK